MVKIVQDGHHVLRQKAAAVPVADITLPETQTIIMDMKSALAAEEDGVGLAAPQIGIPLRIFVVAPDVFAIDKKNKKKRGKKKLTAKEAAAEIAEDTINGALQTVYINPEIIKTSKDKQSMDEGCLSVRPLYGQVVRANKVVVRAYDEEGRLFERGGSGLLAQIFQHEIDHLNGILFIDKASNVQPMVHDDNDSEPFLNNR